MIGETLGTQGGLLVMHRALRSLLVIVIALVVAGGACAPPEELLDDEVGVNLYDRPEEAELENDRERALGESATVHELEATALSFEFVPQLSDTETAGYVVLEAKVENADRGTTDYDRLDWAVEFADGTTKNRIAATSQEGQLESGEIERGQTVQGKVLFQVGSERGKMYILYAPRRTARLSDQERERGVWEIVVEG